MEHYHYHHSNSRCSYYYYYYYYYYFYYYNYYSPLLLMWGTTRDAFTPPSLTRQALTITSRLAPLFIIPTPPLLPPVVVT